jgi:hypothetical protein
MLITLLVAVIVAGILYWIVQLMPMPQPFKNIAICILLLIFALVALVLRGCNAAWLGAMSPLLPFR